MKAAVITFPGSNCDRDLAVAIENATGAAPLRVWHKDHDLPKGLDFIGVPGGFSFGDYLRSGAIAARSPIMEAVKTFVEKGGCAIGICNGFQVLTESGLLPGVLMRNDHERFVCKSVALEVATTNSIFTKSYKAGQTVDIPVAHHDGNYRCDEETLARLNGEDRVAFRYQDNINGSVDNIAGILSENRRVLGMMPHPERAIEPAVFGTDGKAMFTALFAA